jgi:hypothetical protein
VVRSPVKPPPPLPPSPLTMTTTTTTTTTTTKMVVVEVGVNEMDHLEAMCEDLFLTMFAKVPRQMT